MIIKHGAFAAPAPYQFWRSRRANSSLSNLTRPPRQLLSIKLGGRRANSSLSNLVRRSRQVLLGSILLSLITFWCGCCANFELTLPFWCSIQDILVCRNDHCLHCTVHTQALCSVVWKLSCWSCFALKPNFCVFVASLQSCSCLEGWPHACNPRAASGTSCLAEVIALFVSWLASYSRTNPLATHLDTHAHVHAHAYTHVLMLPHMLGVCVLFFAG